MAIEATRVAEQSVESTASGIEWGPIFGGAAAAIGISIILLTLGAGIGVSTVSPWSFGNPSPTVFGINAAIWLIVTQWLSSGLGGYLAGRLRAKWVGIRTDETVFRDTAHGLIAWAVATILIGVLVTVGSMAATAAAAAASTSAAAATQVTPEMAEEARKAAATFSIMTALSMAIGAFVASAAAALGGFHRDDA
jgi:hypothetical protein